MSTLHFETLPPIKIPLIKRFYKDHYPGTKPKSDDLIIVAYQSHTIVGVVRFRHVVNYRLLTGMAVAEDKRQQGLGSRLLRHCQQSVLTQQDYCFAYQHLESFYRQTGFTVITADELPAELKTLYLRYTEQGKSLIPMRYLGNNA
ncbi:MAG: GNAT family N-acetyltransferase [Vibrio sp.]